MWPFSKMISFIDKKIDEKVCKELESEQIQTEQEPWFVINMEYYKKYGHLYKTYLDTISWKCFYEHSITQTKNIPVSCYEEAVRVCCIHNLIIERLGIEDPFIHKDHSQFSFERNNIVKDALDKLKKFKAEHELDDLETKVIDNMIKRYRQEEQ